MGITPLDIYDGQTCIHVHAWRVFLSRQHHNMQGGSSDGAGSGAQLLTRAACSECAVNVQQVPHQLYILSVNSFLWLKSFVEGPGINCFCFPSCWTEAKQRLLKRHKWVQIFWFLYLQFSKHHGLKWHFASGKRKVTLLLYRKSKMTRLFTEIHRKGNLGGF